MIKLKQVATILRWYYGVFYVSLSVLTMTHPRRCNVRWLVYALLSTCRIWRHSDTIHQLSVMFRVVIPMRSLCVGRWRGSLAIWLIARMCWSATSPLPHCVMTLLGNAPAADVRLSPGLNAIPVTSLMTSVSYAAYRRCTVPVGRVVH